jgi:large subunit ribosomal protein L7A
MDYSFNITDSIEGKTEVGLKQTLRAVSEGRAAKVFLAEDCEDRIRQTVKESCNEAGTELVSVPTMRALGRMCGIDVKASCAAVLRG